MMHPSTTLTTLALALQAVFVSADSLTIMSFTGLTGGGNNGLWHTNAGSFEVDAAEGCRNNHGVPNVGDWCMDWQNKRAEFWAFGHKRCFKQAGEFSSRATIQMGVALRPASGLRCLALGSLPVSVIIARRSEKYGQVAQHAAQPG